jgi:hypothetical protein
MTNDQFPNPNEGLEVLGASAQDVGIQVLSVIGNWILDIGSLIGIWGLVIGHFFGLKFPNRES